MDELARWRLISTPIGDVILGHTQAGFLRTSFAALKEVTLRGHEEPTLEPELADWISLALTTPLHIPPPCPLPPGPPFHQRCWQACRRIPIGQTQTYAQLAAAAGNPAASRAAGTAMRRNPTPLVTPCHRVVASNGLGGFSGIAKSNHPARQLKRSLLTHEQQLTEMAG